MPPDTATALPACTPSFSTLRRLPRAVVCGGGIGMFPPLMQRFRQDFEIVATLSPQIGTVASWWYRLISMRWPRHAWYRKWRHHMEKTPAAFRALTRNFARQLEALEGQYDVLLFFGAMHAAGAPTGKPLFVFTDSCRWLSANNVHDQVSHFSSRQQAQRWFALEAQVYLAADRVFVGSDFVRDALIGHYGVAPARAVTTGFGAGPAFGAPYRKVFDGRSILYIGKGDFEKKGGNLLLAAFAIIRQSIPDAVLHIVGQPRLAPRPGVVSHGFLSDRNQLVTLMRNAHVFALPSLVDRNPISVLEAMAAATPCVTSDYGAIPAMVADAGIVVPCNDIPALASALLQVLKDADLARTLGERGRYHYQQRYNWDSVWRTMRSEIAMVLQ